MSKYIKGVNRFQTQLLPPSVEDFISENNEVRIIDAWVNTLDFNNLKFKNATPSHKGAPSYDPRDLLKIYIYCYPKKIRSSRHIAKELHRNLELIWLVGGITPDFRTISDFRKNNTKAIKPILLEFNKLCLRLKVFEREFASLDGSKFKAVNSKDNNFTQDKLIDRIERAEKHVDEYLELLNSNDINEFSTEDKIDIQEKLQKAKEKAIKYNHYLTQMTNNGDTQISLTDPESRLMKCNNNMLVGYNFQVSTETKNHIITNIEGSNKPYDNGSIFSSASKTKEIMQVDQIEVAVDGGYVDPVDIKNCFENKIVPILPDGEYSLSWDYHEHEITDDIKKGSTPEDVKKCLEAGVVPDCYSELTLDVEVKETVEKTQTARVTDETNPDILKRKASEGFFVRDKINNCVYCPYNNILNYKRSKEDTDIFIGNSKCLNCPRKCTVENIKEFSISKKYDIAPSRTFKTSLPRSNNKKVVKKVIIKYIPDKNKYKLRKCTSEHPFGTLKRAYDASYFLLKGLDKVTSELTLSVLGYNFKRLINIFGVEKLIGLINGDIIMVENIEENAI